MSKIKGFYRKEENDILTFYNYGADANNVDVTYTDPTTQIETVLDLQTLIDEGKIGGGNIIWTDVLS